MVRNMVNGILTVVFVVGLPLGLLVGLVKLVEHDERTKEKACKTKACLTPNTQPFVLDGHCLCLEVPK